MNPALTTEIHGWFDTRKHDAPLDSTEFNVCVTLFINGVRVGVGYAYRPFREIPYATCDAEIRETELWAVMVAEATAKAEAEAGLLLDALKSSLAA